MGATPEVGWVCPKFNSPSPGRRMLCEGCEAAGSGDRVGPTGRGAAGVASQDVSRGELLSKQVWDNPKVAAAFADAIAAERKAGQEIWRKGCKYREALESSGVLGLLRFDGYARILDRVGELGEGACESPGDTEPLEVLCSNL